MRRRIVVSFVACVALGLAAQAASADVVSSFSSNDEGWRGLSFTDFSTNNFTVNNGPYSLNYHATGGNPGGYVGVDVDPDSGYFTFLAPSAYLGNMTGATGLSYDFIHPSGAINLNFLDVILEGGGLRLIFKSSPDFGPDGTWKTVNASFTPSAAWHVTNYNGVAPTAGQFQTVLANLTGLYINGEYTNGSESAGLDNVRLFTAGTAAPLPSSFAMALLLLPALFLLRRRRDASLD
jgi:hypothetical protein